ncbi:hypothetical protein OD91_0392 [Lutibacter sp. Hel_I_33_5]|uniref:hypothetical protein n=1 Tax=Lutibacter sp. Hel_I_33_5 TaxID=1566289 RepID=UPI0011A51483|nr:hypothetical protein [Lutibacter sp. Hel_I_33_5]TVZ55148.1 hypothetical protein OD91_0392 [Lutibacter sp. Hel_I_33_5]
MKKILNYVAIALIATLIVSCGNKDKFTIAKGKVGGLTTKTTIQELETIFKNDSIIKNLSEGSTGDNYFQDDDEYLVYEKGGKHLLTIVPREQLDSTSTIKSVQIFDNRYKTETGLSLASTFLNVNNNNKINKVETSLASATLFIDDLNATIAIDKEELGLKQTSMQKVTPDQIPDLARIKSLVVWFN